MGFGVSGLSAVDTVSLLMESSFSDNSLLAVSWPLLGASLGISLLLEIEELGGSEGRVDGELSLLEGAARLASMFGGGEMRGRVRTRGKAEGTTFLGGKEPLGGIALDASPPMIDRLSVRENCTLEP